MQKLPEVESAKALFAEGSEWSIWRWLLEKRRVRATADAGTAAHDELEKRVKAAWSGDLKKAYHDGKGLDPKIKLAAQRVKKADEDYQSAKREAEAAFLEAERRMSGSIAREAAQKAIAAYILREKAIQKAEAAARVK